MPVAPSTSVSLSARNTAAAEFVDRYAVNGGGQFAPNIELPWLDFKTAVVQNGGIMPVEEILLRFIHRFNNGQWFLTMQVCRMDLVTGAITGFGNRFDLIGNTIIPSQFIHDFDQNYFANVTCDDAPINPATFVNSLFIPWHQQISQIHCQNMLHNTNEVSIVLESVAFDYTSLPGQSLVPFPHTICVYMSQTGHGPYLDDCNYTMQFSNKAGDHGSICPPDCNAYSWPSSLPVVPKCS